MKSAENSSSSVPKYLSYKEWKDRRVRRSRRVLRFTLGAAATAAALCVAYAVAGCGRAFIARQALLSSLSGVGDYEFRILTVSPNGNTKAWRTDTQIGDDWQTSLLGGQLVFTKKGEDYFTDDHLGHFTASAKSWTGAQSVVIQAVEAVGRLSPLHFYDRDGQISAQRQSNGSNRYSFCAYDTNWTIELDGTNRLLALTSVSADLGHWADTEVATRIAQPKFQPFDLYERNPKQSPVPANFALPTGANGEIAAADVNQRGDIFFRLAGMQIDTVPGVWKEHGDRYYEVQIIPASDGRHQNLTELRFIALDNIAPIWPATYDIVLQGPGMKHVALKYSFAGPTCLLLPPYEYDGASDLPFYQALRDAARNRSRYFSNVVYNAKGEPIDRPIVFTGRETTKISDRQEAVHQNLRAIFFDHQADAPRHELLNDWLACYMQLQSVGQPNDVKKSLADAKELIPSIHPSGGVEDQLLLSLKQEHMQ